MRWIIIAAAILGSSSIIIGATLRHLGSDLDTDILQTALRYHQLHSVVLLALGLHALDKKPSMHLTIPAVLFILGIFVFSGSLYATILWNLPVLGYLTPLGGICLISAWLSLCFIKQGITSGIEKL